MAPIERVRKGVPYMLNFEGRLGTRFVCRNCGHRVFEPENMVNVENVHFCQMCTDNYTTIHYILEDEQSNQVTMYSSTTYNL